MAFNPDAYLAKRSGKSFDPDAYLRGVSAMPRADRVNKAPEEIGLLETALRVGAPYMGSMVGREQVAQIPRVGGAAFGPAGAVAGEGVAQAIEGEFRPGGIAGATIGSVLLPMRAASALANAVRSGAQNAAASATEQAIDQGEVSGLRTALAGVLGGGGAAIGRGAGGVSREAPVLPRGWTETERDSVVAAMQKGMKIAPVEVRDTFLQRRLMGAAGPTDVRAQLRQENSIRAKDLVKEDINVPKRGELTDDAIKREINRASEPMAEIEALGQPFEEALNRVRRAREDASLVWQARKADFRKVSPDEVAQAQQAVKDAETELGLMLNQVDPTLGKRYGIARQEVARANVAKEALNPDSGKVDIGELADRSQSRLPMDGNMKVIGSFANTDVGSQYAGGRTTVPPGSQALRTAMGLGMATNSTADNLVPAATGGGYIVVGDLARKMATGDRLQKAVLEDLVGRQVLSREADAIRRAIMAAGRTTDDSDDEYRRMLAALRGR